MASAGKEVICGGCTFTCSKFSLMLNSEELLREFLINHGVLSNRCVCERCGNIIKADWKSNIFYCLKTGAKGEECRFCRSVYSGTCFSFIHFSLPSLCSFVLYWLTRYNPRQVFIERELDLSSTTVIDWSSFCREVCLDWCIRKNKKVGGVGVVVEIDVGKVGKRKYNCGRLVVGQWVIGGVERDNPLNMFMVPVDSRDTSTLIRVLNENVASGTVIMSDCLKEHEGTNKKTGRSRSTTNHLLKFIDPDYYARVIRAWKEVRAKVRRYGKKMHYGGYLAEFMFKRAFPDHRDRFHHFFTAAGILYPPCRNE